jgi:hypothetical protein
MVWSADQPIPLGMVRPSRMVARVRSLLKRKSVPGGVVSMAVVVEEKWMRAMVDAGYITWEGVLDISRQVALNVLRSLDHNEFSALLHSIRLLLLQTYKNNLPSLCGSPTQKSFIVPIQNLPCGSTAPSLLLNRSSLSSLS